MAPDKNLLRIRLFNKEAPCRLKAIGPSDIVTSNKERRLHGLLSLIIALVARVITFLVLTYRDVVKHDFMRSFALKIIVRLVSRAFAQFRSTFEGCGAVSSRNIECPDCQALDVPEASRLCFANARACFAPACIHYLSTWT